MAAAAKTPSAADLAKQKLEAAHKRLDKATKALEVNNNPQTQAALRAAQDEVNTLEHPPAGSPAERAKEAGPPKMVSPEEYTELEETLKDAREAMERQTNESTVKAYDEALAALEGAAVTTPEPAEQPTTA